MSAERLDATTLIEGWIASRTIPRTTLERIFSNVPTDFVLRIGTRLPLFAHRSGAIAITLFGVVTALRCDWNRRTPLEQCALLRHEAEHVRQQRAAPILFYLRYAVGWLRGVIGIKGANRGHRAYRAIPYEVEAYAAEAEAVRLLAER